jgi:hypothetical protein
MLYALDPVKVRATPECRASTAIAEAKALSYTLGTCIVHLYIPGSGLHIIEGDSVKMQSNLKSSEDSGL